MKYILKNVDEKAWKSSKYVIFQSFDTLYIEVEGNCMVFE